MNKAALYDLIYRSKDYDHEAKLIDGIVRQYQPNAASLLDVACGTGSHLRYLKQHYQCKGVDIDPDMLALAKQKHPDVPFYEGDMLSLYMGERFDVVMCLFAAIGYVKTPANLQRAVSTMGKHVARHGLLIVEPWLTPQNFRTGDKGLTVVETPDVNVVRMNTSKRRIEDGADISRLEMHYLIGDAEVVDTFSETHDLGLFSNEMYAQAFSAAGFELKLEHNGLAGRGLFVGVKQS